ncbi:MAG: sensor histidine kinase, partial [Chloroflexi bacterium]|nr:sensor histidine kinase [Chloroflexota bacterium]
VRVADSGPGIPGAEKERIFERFYQAGRAHSADGHPGLGLGLAITRQIIAAHGGAIQVADHPPQGAVFIVTLPVARE